MAVSEQVMDAIRRMSVSDLVDLVRALEAEMQNSGGGVAARTNQSSSADISFDIRLLEFSANKTAVIRAVREVTDLGLRGAHAVVEAGPPLDPADGNDEGMEGSGVPVLSTPPRPSGQAGAEACLQ